MARHDHDVVEDLLIDAARGVDVGHGHERGSYRERLDAAAVLNGGHGEGVLRLHSADAARRPHDVRALDVRLIGKQVARGHRHIDRLDDDAALPVQHAKRVGELQNVAERLHIPVAAAALEVSDVGRSRYGSEVDDVVANVQVPRGVAGVQHEALGCVAELGLDELAPESHHLRALVYQRSGATEDLACRRAADFQPRFLENAQRREHNALHLLRAENLQRCPAIGEPRHRCELRPGGAHRTCAAAATGRCRSLGHESALGFRGAAESTPGPRRHRRARVPLRAEEQ